MIPSEYLESLQASHGMKPVLIGEIEERLGPRLGEPFLIEAEGDAERARQAQERYYAELKEAEDARPTRFEDPLMYKIMMDLASRIETAAEAVLPEVRSIPVFGTLPLRELNAMACEVPDSEEFLIVFQSGVFGFANLLTKAVTGSLPVAPADDGWVNFCTDLELVEKRWEEEDQSALGRLDELLTAYLVAGSPTAAQQYFLKPPFTALSQILLEGFELFVFGHEFGHVYAGHLESGLTTAHSLQSEQVERLSSNWEQEFQADFLGFVLTLRAMSERNLDAALSYVGCDLFFSSISLVDRALSMLRFGELRATPETKTHPPVKMRQEMLRYHLDQLDLNPEQAASAHHLAETVEQLLDLMWLKLSPGFEARHEAGIRPAPSWQG